MVAPPNTGGGIVRNTPAACPSPPMPGAPLPGLPNAGIGVPPKAGVGVPPKPGRPPGAPNVPDEGSIAGPLAPKLKVLAVEAKGASGALPPPYAGALDPRAGTDGALPAPKAGVLAPNAGIEGLELAAPVVKPLKLPAPKPVGGAPKAGPLPAGPKSGGFTPKGVLTLPLANENGAGPAAEDWTAAKEADGMVSWVTPEAAPHAAVKAEG